MEKQQNQHFIFVSEADKKHSKNVFVSIVRSSKESEKTNDY